MKAMIFQGKGKIELKELPMPKCGDNDVIIKNIYAAICGSDISAYYHGGKDNWIFAGYEFGHEMVSRVEEVGKNVTDFKVGDYVYPYPLFVRGDTTRSATVGGFSEYILVPNCKINHSLYLLPEGISLKTAAIIEPFTLGTHASRRATPKKGEKAIVFGAGAIGISAAMALKYFGKVRGLAGEVADVDIYIDAVGAKSIVDSYLSLAKIFTRMVIVGVHHQPVTLNLIPIIYGHGAIIGSGGYMPEDVIDVMKIMESNKYDLETLITHEYPQEQLEQAIIKASQVDEALKVVIKYE